MDENRPFLSANFGYSAAKGRGVAALGITQFLRPDPGASGQLWQTVNLPSSPGRLTFKLSIATSETGTAARDILAVDILSATGAVLATPLTLSNLNKTAGYANYSVALGAYAGRAVRIQFRGAEDNAQPHTFLLDEVMIEAPTTIRGHVKNAATGAGVKADVCFSAPTRPARMTGPTFWQTCRAARVV